MLRLILCLMAFLFSNCFAQTDFKSHIQALPKNIEEKMLAYSWHTGCPPLTTFVYVQLNYWGFDHKPHEGELIVNKELAPEIVEIFKTLYQRHFPLQSMKLVDDFKGNDLASMTANNTSSFNCRPPTGYRQGISKHSYGTAIDINPLINPYVKGKTLLPTAGAIYANRESPYPGKIIKNSFVYQEFIKHGWEWGGDWKSVKDYQHFEKRDF